MIARQATRAMNPLQQSVRRYASQSTQASGTSPWVKYGGGALALSFASFLVLRWTSTPPTPEEHEKIMKAKAAKAGPPSKAFLGGEQGFLDLKLESVETINHNTKKFRFALPNPDDVSGLQIASALITKYKGPDMDKPIIRPYTPISDEDARGHVDFIIKRYPGGPMSEHFHNLEPSQRLEFKGPIQKFKWEPNVYDHISLIAGGTGITPMWQLCRAIFNNPEDKTKVTLVFGNVSEEDILLKRELEDLENKYPQRFKAFYMLDKPSSGWTKGTGHIDEKVLKTVLPEPKQERSKIFVCGPPGMYKALSGMKNSPTDQGELSGTLKKMGYSQDQVYKF